MRMITRQQSRANKKQLGHICICYEKEKRDERIGGEEEYQGKRNITGPLP